jgi:hypothetical protein
MSSQPSWIEAWLTGKPMPPNNFPKNLQSPLLNKLEEWLTSPVSPRCQLEDFVSTNKAYHIMDGLLYSGFCQDRTLHRRKNPCPVLASVLNANPPPCDEKQLDSAIISAFASALADWIRLHRSGEPYDVSP